VPPEDFKPGDVLYLNKNKSFAPRGGGPFTVLDPVRTRKGKLRLQGPKGGYMTTWWNKIHLDRGLIRRGESA
jgi:hypothetical protein